MRRITSRIVMGLLLMLALARAATAPVNSISGTVIDKKQNYPIPGLTVYVIDPSGGKAGPEITDNSGHFVITKVPRRRETCYVEIYWGKQLYARKPVIVDRDVNLGTIFL